MKPNEPTQREREEHELTHEEFKSWCPACMKARAHADQHRKVAPEDRDAEVPTMSADFCFFDTWEELVKLTAIVLRCDTTFYTFARVCAGKSTRN